MPEVEVTKEVSVEEVSVEGKGEEPEDDWVDVLGSGDLLKKVCKKLYYCLLTERGKYVVQYL